MLDQKFLEALEAAVGKDRIKLEEPMKNHITFRVGGPAQVFLSPSEGELRQSLALARQYGLPVTLIGNGSNLLAADAGVPGLVLEIGARMAEISIQGNEIRAGAGSLLSKVAAEAAAKGLGGMEFAAGIPGSLGGAVVMNAGAYGGEIKDILKEVTVLDQEGQLLTIPAEDLDLSYRHSCVPEKGYVVVAATLCLNPKPEEEIRSLMAELRQKRLDKQPLEYPSAGSTFKRPEGYFAGKLIEDAGLRGYRVGDAQVSEKHCGFVINRGNATAGEIAQLMQDVEDKVQAQFGVTLEPEVKRIGAW